AGQPLRVTLDVQNTAETRWLAAEEEGWTRIGAHLYRAGEPDELIDFDWVRVALPRDLAQYERVALPVQLPPLSDAGIYRIVFDIVVEGVLWFGDRGSPTTSLTLSVRHSDR